MATSLPRVAHCLTVVFRETALRNLARIRSEDKELFAQTRRAISALADQPYPQNAVAWGATGVYRLRAVGASRTDAAGGLRPRLRRVS